MIQWLIALSFLLPTYANADSDLVAGRYDHELHNEKVFKPLKVECSHCHNFEVNKITGKAVPNAKMQETILRNPLIQICHECHRSAETKYQSAPKDCTACHRSVERLKVIKPQNHSNVAWKSTHSIAARANGDSCLSCHMTSQCARCHLQRNEVDLKNHPRNFRFTHSIQARLSPERCDACHTKSYCMNCHMGKR